MTPLMCASANGYDAVVGFLLEKGAAVNKRDKASYNQGIACELLPCFLVQNMLTALHWACAGAHLSCIEIIVRSGGDIFAENKAGTLSHP
jgi:ankyrin repeat protein